MLRLLSALLTAVALPLIAAEPSWLVRTWQTDDGLPNNDVTCLAQGGDGAMMFATRGGLARFDGLRFREIEVEAPGTGGGVNAVLPARDGSLWLVARGVIVHQQAGKADQVMSMPALNVGGARETAFFEDANGVIWLCYEGGRFHRIEGDRIEGDRIEQAPVAEGLSPTFASGAALDAQGNVWAAGPRVLARWQGGRFEHIAELPKDRCMISPAVGGGVWIGAGRKLLRCTDAGAITEVGEITGAPAGSRISSMFEDRSGKLWLGTFGAGLWLRTSEGFQTIALPNADVWWLTEDREGNLWAATAGGGVCRVRPRVLTLLDEPGGPRGEIARAMCTDVRGDLWITVQNGARLMVRRTGQWLDLAPGKDWPANKAIRLNSGSDGQVWIGTGDGDLVRWDGRAFTAVALPPDPSKPAIYSIIETSDRTLCVGRGFNVWRGRPGGQWRDVPMPAESGPAQVFAQDASGQLWAGTVGGFLLREENGVFVREAAEALGRECSGVRALLPMPDGSLLVGTQGAGIARLANGRCRVISRAQGLPHKVISQLVIDPQNRVWAGSDAGIFMVPYEQITAIAEGRASEVHATSFGRSEGVSGLQANTSFPGALLLPDGQLWMATRSGIALLDTHGVGKNATPPQPSIESMTVNDGEPARLWKISSLSPPEADNIITSTQAMIPPGVRSLAFEFGASSYAAPESVSIRYQLQGIDSEPHLADAGRRAVYGRVPPGDYTLSVSACNNDGVWSTYNAVLGLRVQPFYYETAWFFVLCLIAAIALVSFIGYRIAHARYHRRTEELRRQAALHAERARIARDMHDQIGASLTQISLLSDIALAQGSDLPQIPRLAETARQAVTALDEIVWAVDPKQDRFDSLLEYLAPQITELAQAANLRCRFDFPPQGLQRHLPAHFRHQIFLIIREAVNNTLKHARATELKLLITTSDSHLHIEISDNGTGFPPGTPRGNGLNNIQSRIEDLLGTFTLDSTNGTRLTFKVPWPQS